MDPIATLLQEHGLAKTAPRLKILKTFMKFPTAITHNDLERELGKNFDRVTIYRTLISFEEKGLIHKIMAPSGEARYAMCSTHCDEHTHNDDHIHFSCNNCGSVYCLTDVVIPDLRLPKGFQFTALNFIIEGVCKNCLVKTGTAVKKKK